MTKASMIGGNSTLANKCLDFCQALTSQSKAFTFTLNLGTDFSFSLDTRGSSVAPEVRKKLSPSAIRRNARRKEEFLNRKSEALKKGDSDCDVNTSIKGKRFQCDQCKQFFKNNKGLTIHLGKMHMDIIPQSDGHIEQITADAAVQTLYDKNQEYKESETRTDSPFSCGNYCETEEVFDNKHAWKMHMLKEHLDSMKVLARRHSRFLQEALEYKSPTSQTRDPDILRFLETYQEL